MDVKVFTKDDLIRYIDCALEKAELAILDAPDNPDNPQDIDSPEYLYGSESYYAACQNRNHIAIIKNWIENNIDEVRSNDDAMLTPKCWSCGWYGGSIRDYSSKTTRGGGLLCNYCKKFMRAVNPVDFCSYHTKLNQEEHTDGV